MFYFFLFLFLSFFFNLKCWSSCESLCCCYYSSLLLLFLLVLVNWCCCCSRCWCNIRRNIIIMPQSQGQNSKNLASLPIVWLFFALFFFCYYNESSLLHKHSSGREAFEADSESRSGSEFKSESEWESVSESQKHKWTRQVLQQLQHLYFWPQNVAIFKCYNVASSILITFLLPVWLDFG